MLTLVSLSVPSDHAVTLSVVSAPLGPPGCATNPIDLTST